MFAAMVSSISVVSVMCGLLVGLVMSTVRFLAVNTI
jgi:hypothetical protein